MRFVFGALVRSRVVSIAQGKRIFEGTKLTNMIYRTTHVEGDSAETSCGPMQ